MVPPVTDRLLRATETHGATPWIAIYSQTFRGTLAALGRAREAASVVRRRTILSGLGIPAGILAPGLVACGEGSESPKQASGPAPDAKAADAGAKPAAGGPQGTQVVAATADPKKVAAALLPKVVAFIDAVNSKDQAKIASAKKEMQQEADKSDEAVRNSTGPAANAVNAALNNIRLSVMSNDVKTLERAKQLLEDASK